MDGTTLVRVNEKGIKGIWRCKKCLTPEQRRKYLDPELKTIIETIERGKP